MKKQPQHSNQIGIDYHASSTPTRRKTNTKIIVIGLGTILAGVIVVVAAMLVFSASIAVLIVEVGPWVAGAGGVGFLGWCGKSGLVWWDSRKVAMSQSGFHLRQLEADTRIKEYAADKAQIDRFIHSTPEGTFLIDPTMNRKPKFYPHSPALLREAIAETEPVSALAEPMPQIVEVMRHRKTPLLVKAQQQSGKTTTGVNIAKALELPVIFVGWRDESEYHQQFDNIRLFVEEQQPNQNIIGAGFEAVMQSLRNYEPMVLFLDDFINCWMSVGDNQQLETMLAFMATQSEAHNKRVILTTHSDTAGAAGGLNRLGAILKENFLKLEVDPPALNPRTAEVVNQANTGKLYEPGGWRGEGRVVALAGRVVAPVVVGREDRIRAMIRADPGITNNAILRKLGEVYANGEPKKNEKIYAELNRIRGKIKNEHLL